MSRQPQKQIVKVLEEKNDHAREMALQEIKALKADLTEVEKVLSGRKKSAQIALMDIVHGAFEVYRNAAVIFENESLMADMEVALEEGRFREYLEGKGAKLLTKPDGWHWFSPKGEMVFLGPAEETAKAAQKLKTRLSRGGKKKPAPRTEKAEPAKEANEEAFPQE
ncbi:MAG TPA: hypothetical protein VJ934_06860 [Desulfomicrobiaceae bacterium]|nr:hypothetical protein [Desulfomicrobiaceae bacterium]